MLEGPIGESTHVQGRGTHVPLVLLVVAVTVYGLLTLAQRGPGYRGRQMLKTIAGPA